jgi:RNA polymerase sigma factor (sigma-70 family)
MNNQKTENPILNADEVRRLLEFLQEVPDTAEGEHLTEGDVVLYGAGSSDEDVARIDRHLSSCESCAIRMERSLSVPGHVLLAVRSKSVAPVRIDAAEQVSFFQPGPLARAKNRNSASLELLLTDVALRVKRLFAIYRIPQQDSEDLLQQSLLALLCQWERVRDPERWLLGTLRRHCLMYWRTQRRRIYSTVDSAILEWLSEPIAPAQERSDLIIELERLIERLPSRCRALLRLRFQLGIEPEEVARKLGYRVSSIGKITTRCLAALTRELLASGLAERFGEKGHR